jgi:hypothetical protein
MESGGRGVLVAVGHVEKNAKIWDWKSWMTGETMDMLSG